MGLLGAFRVEDGELGDMALTNDSHRTGKLVVHHDRLWLQANNVVGALVADKLVSGDVHKFDVLRHDDVCRHLIIDIHGGLLEVTLEDTLIIGGELVDIMDGYCVFGLSKGRNHGHRHESHYQKSFHIGCVGYCVLFVLSVYQVYDGVVLDASLVLTDILRHGTAGTLVHVLQGLKRDDLRRDSSAAARIELNALTGNVRTGILHHLTESRLGDIEAFHAIIVEDGQIDFDKLVAD